MSTPQFGKPSSSSPVARYGKAAKSRVSQGAGQVLFGKGGLGYIARRGIDYGTSLNMQSLDALARMATQQPLELISLLPDIVPEVGLAAWNGLRLGCAPGTVRIKAMTVKKGGGSEEAPDGTAAIADLFSSLPDEVGQFEDVLAQNFLMVMFSGMCAVEAVPGPRGTGLAQIWPVNSLTLRFKRENDGTLALYQRQTSNASGLGVFAAGLGGLYEPMPMNRFFWASLDGFPDDSYGRAPFAAALTAVLECMAFIRDLTTAFHRVGTPHHDIGFDFAMWAKIAQDIGISQDPKEINDWVMEKYAEAQAMYASLEVDDAFFHDINSKVNAVGSGDKWPDVTGIWSLLRLRLIQALKQMPSLMGVVEGSTETWSSIDYSIYTSGLESIVRKAAAPLVRAANLHLQLLGLPYQAVCETDKLRTVDATIEAEREAMQIANEEAKVTNNWQLNSTAAMNVTGSAPPTPQEIAQDTPVKAGPAPVSPVPPTTLPPTETELVK